MSPLFSNPEFTRYFRSQMRLARVLSAASISLLLSFSIAFFVVHQRHIDGDSLRSAGFTLLQVALTIQVLVLSIGGGIACLNSIYLEKEQNTFDYQRITRLRPVELVMGKLFGAPLLMYFICLCLVPLTVFGAILAGLGVAHLLAVYVVLLVASIMFHAFNVLLSLVLVRGAHVTGIILSLVVLYFISVGPSGNFFHLQALGPFLAVEFVNNMWFWQSQWATDVFWGHRVPHVPVLVVLDVLLASWFLLAVVRNIKKDPRQYELYSPPQFLGLAVFLNLVIISFYNTAWMTPLDTHSVFLTFDMVILSALGIALLRSRERTRSLLRASSHPASSWGASVWPAPILAVAAAFAGALIVVCLNYAHSLSGDWSLRLAVFRSSFFVIWIVRDIQFLQLMNLRRGKHPLAMGLLFAGIYYFSATMLLAASGCFRYPQSAAVTSLFLPTPVFLLDSASWAQAPSVWTAGLAVHLGLFGFFVYLQRDKIRELQNVPVATAATQQAIAM